MAMMTRASRRVRALSMRLARASTRTEPTPASRTSMSISPDRASSERPKMPWTSGRRSVRKMKSNPWTKKAALMAKRAGPTFTSLGAVGRVVTSSTVDRLDHAVGQLADGVS